MRASICTVRPVVPGLEQVDLLDDPGHAVLGNDPTLAWQHPLFSAMFPLVVAALEAGDPEAHRVAPPGQRRGSAALGREASPLLSASDFHPFFAYAVGEVSASS